MTVFISDKSHYDGLTSLATAQRMRSEGIGAVVHKVGEGTGGDDAYDGTALAACRDAGIARLGGYHVVRSGPVTPQVDALIGLADRDEPWWRTWPLWFWMVDLERWSYDQVPAATGIAMARELRTRTGKAVFLYASHGQYGDQLTGWDGPLWNADYVSAPAAGFAAMYPGDSYTPLHGGTWRGGWTAYSGQTPMFLQYTSSATIAGMTTCDVSAFRGTGAQLDALINPAATPTPVPAPIPVPALMPWPAWMPHGHYFGLKAGPVASHGGVDAREQAAVKAIQRRLLALGHARNYRGVVTTNAAWADGDFGRLTADAVTRWQRRAMPHTQFYGQVWSDDWAALKPRQS